MRGREEEGLPGRALWGGIVRAQCMWGEETGSDTGGSEGPLSLSGAHAGAALLQCVSPLAYGCAGSHCQWPMQFSCSYPAATLSQASPSPCRHPQMCRSQQLPCRYSEDSQACRDIPAATIVTGEVDFWMLRAVTLQLPLPPHRCVDISPPSGTSEIDRGTNKDFAAGH